tara:strand:- start:363 stop:1295 length:933 start_codon:yes stop_codon:yes gene_type:complete
MIQTTIYYDKCFKDHVSTLDYPECSDRVKNIIDLINKEGLNNISIVRPSEVEKSLIYSAHSKEFVDETLSRFPSNNEIVFLDQETPVSSGSLQATMRAAGAGIDAVNAIMKDETSNAFCIVRPPGHHACFDRSMGFCVFNNVAIAAHYLINNYNFNNIAIIDFDVHHGNGTQDIFYENSKVHYYSTHQYPLYPGTGDINEVGVGNIINAPLSAGTDSSTYQKIFDERIMYNLDKQKPDFVIISAGFDAHKKDPLASINLTENDFQIITQKLKLIANKYCDGRIISMLEGGYDIQALEQSMLIHLSELQKR